MKRETSLNELRAIDYICGFDMQLIDSEPYIKERLKSIPDAWRQFRIMRAASEKLVTGLLDSLDLKTMKHVCGLVEHGEVLIRPRSFTKQPDFQFVDHEDLRVLINAAMRSTCAMCMNRGSEVKKCELRKSLMVIAPPEEIPKNGACPYQEVALECELGKYI